VQFECKVTQILRLQTRDGAELDQWLVMGEAVGIHIDRTLIEDGVYQTAKAGAILRAGACRLFRDHEGSIVSDAQTGLTGGGPRREKKRRDQHRSHCPSCDCFRQKSMKERSAAGSWRRLG
jgi:hypothetical protein